MRRLVLILAAIAAVGFTLPVTTSAEAAKVVIKSGGGHGHHYARGHHRNAVVVKHRHHDNGLHRGWRNRHHAKVVVR